MVLHTDVEPPVTTEAAPEVEEEVQGRSLSQIAWGRLRRDRVAMISLGVLIVALSLAAFSGVINRLMGHSIQGFNQDLISNEGGLPLGHLGGVSLSHLLGVEPGTGRDIFARLLVGSRYSFIIAFSATALTLFLGITVGAIAGYSKGWLDGLLGRIMDLILSFPLLLILLALSPVLVQRLQATFGLEGNSAEVVYLILVLSLFGWPYLARVVRGQVLSLREREFVESAVSLGSSTRRVLFREILPNLWAPVIVYATLLLPELHRRRGDPRLSRRRPRGADSLVGIDAGVLGELLQRRPVLPLRPRHLPLHRRPGVQPAGRFGTRRPRSAGGEELANSPSAGCTSAGRRIARLPQNEFWIQKENDGECEDRAAWRSACLGGGGCTRCLWGRKQRW